MRLQAPQPNGSRRGQAPVAATRIRVWEPGVVAARAAADAARERSEQLRREVKAAQAAAESPGAGEAAQAELAALQTSLCEAKSQVKEANRQVNEFLDWWLATSSPVRSVEDALQSEAYHKVEKTGLRMEGQRFETRARLEAALAILAAVAIRILQLRYARDENPEAPAESVATPATPNAMVAAATKHKGGR